MEPLESKYLKQKTNILSKIMVFYFIGKGGSLIGSKFSSVEWLNKNSTKNATEAHQEIFGMSLASFSLTTPNSLQIW